MDLRIQSKIDGGAHADVYLATTDLGYRVAVKLIRPAAEGVSDAIAHATALSRVDHENVVRVITTTEIPDPETGEARKSVVMEYIDGVTLEKHLDTHTLSLSEAESIGQRILDGLDFIHQNGLVHGDLHAENVLIANEVVKIIDILYTGSLAKLSTTLCSAKKKHDISSAKMLLYDIATKSNASPKAVAEFGSKTKDLDSLSTLREAFLFALNEPAPQDIATQVSEVIARFKDLHFRPGEAYATALSEVTSSHIISNVLEEIVIGLYTRLDHQDYLRTIWNRLDTNTQDSVLQLVAKKLEDEVPSGNWLPHMQMLQAFGTGTWKRIRPLVRLRLEGIIIHDILLGRYNYYGSGIELLNPGGILGTWAVVFGSEFENKDELIENITTMLNHDWFTQNYIANYFFPHLELLASNKPHRRMIIEGLKRAISNNALLVKEKLEELPENIRNVLEIELQ